MDSFASGFADCINRCTFLIELRLNHQAVEERAGCSTFALFLMSCHCYHLFESSSQCLGFI